jgi:peptidoglycan-associated lipoprotein
MKGMFQTVLTIFVGVSFLLLAGCPKKITPIKKTSRATRPVARVPKVVPPSPPILDSGAINNSSDTLKEEEIPRIAQREESDAPLNKIDLQEKASALKEVYFDLDQWATRPIDLPVIENNANWLIAHPGAKIRIEGHGDNRGTNEYNLVLGEKRANSVRNAIVSLGVDASKLTVVSFGEERPFCMQDSDDCFQENRRVHFHVE